MPTPQDLHMVGHASRIAHVLKENPKHPRAAEYAETLRQYRIRWSLLTPAQRKSLAETAEQHAHDQDVTAAVAALEG